MHACILDGATGTELERRAVACDLPLWSARALVEAPEVVRATHRDHAAARAHAPTTNTCRTQRRTLARAGLAERAAELTARAVQLARERALEAGATSVLVLGSAAPLEDCYAPEQVPEDDKLAGEHAEHAQNLVAAASTRSSSRSSSAREATRS
jgi:S-methylmethionine-dependent homocysteine/selenocysteine methylase